jgi:hydrogenase maturation protease
VPPANDITIVCVGNGLAGDDGIGEAVYNRLKADSCHSSLHLVLLGLGGLALLEHLQAQRLILIIDAMQLGSPSGTVHVMESKDVPSFSAQAVSLHGIGLQETLSIARELYPECIPERIVLIGVEGRCFTELGTPLSAPVEAAIDKVLNEINHRIALHSACKADPEMDCEIGTRSLIERMYS